MESGQNVHKQVNRVVFGVLSPKIIKKMSSAKIVTPELYDKEGYPVDGGLMDTRLGVIDPGLRCKTCGSKLKECVGHFGYISLARPVIHISFVKVVHALLRSTCRECGRVLIPKNQLEKISDELRKTGRRSGANAQKRMLKEIIASSMKNSKCPYCRSRQQKITIEKPTTFYEGDKRLSPIEIRGRFEKISDDDEVFLGLNSSAVRPEWLVLTVLPIPPVTMRPSITLETGERSEDDLTHKLGDIVRINQRLFENINAGAPEIIIEDLWDLLQYHITTFFDNAVAQLPPARHRSGQPLKTLTERIKSKEGRIRHNLLGKRTNFCARTVISPDPLLELNEVGVPEIIAKKLSVPIRATDWNIEYLKEFVKRGPNKYPGANYIIRPDGKKKKLTEETAEQSLEELQPGYIVERQLMDGDIALFNRQPSLHRMSMMCHKVRVLPYKTLRANPAVNHPYNADYDGDEMNLHIPQTEEAMAEAETLMMVQTQLTSPRYGLSVIGCIQDAISGNYLLTKKDTVLSRQDAVDMLSSIGVTDLSRLGKKERVSGKEVFSVLLPENFSFSGKSKSFVEPSVVIKNGQLLEGVMDKNNLGEGAGLMLRNINKDYGRDFALDMLSKLFRLGIMFLMKRGFTIQIDDTDMPADVQKKIDETVEKAEAAVKELISAYYNNNLEAFPGRSIKETLELKILEILNHARNETGRLVAENANQASHTIIMANSGARGSLLNLAQIAACVGQQALRGKRIEKGYKNRTLSFFQKGDLEPEAHGFIRKGFKHGMQPAEFFFQAMVGRDSLMDTALRTPKSGYLYRRLANALQDLKVEYDYSVRDSSKNIIQFVYGEDGIDVSKSEGGTIDLNRVARFESCGKQVIKMADNKEISLPLKMVEGLKKMGLSGKKLSSAMEQLKKEHADMLVEPGESVGIVGAESIGEPGTQMTLNTFHFAGVAEMNVTMGLPRIIEILDGRKEPTTPMMEIYLKKPYSLGKDIKKIALSIKETTLSDLALEFSINLADSRVEVKLNREKAKELGVTDAVFLKAVKAGMKGVKADIKGDVLLLKAKNKDEGFNEVYKLKEKIKGCYIKGVKGISQILPVKKENEFIIITAGTNLKDILSIDEVDDSRTNSNNIFEVEKVLGIEAARQAIINEVFRVMENQGLNVDIRHLMLVADTMCFSGKVKGITRYGVVSEKASVLAKASFETPIQHLTAASLQGEVDELNAVVENVMLNQPVPTGTGLPGLITKLKE